MSDRLPSQIKFIVGNEAAERFSFYGMKAILTLFMTDYLLFSKDSATSVYHLFVMAVYFTPLLGGYLSDRYWGKYRTIMTLSFVYIAGHGVLAIWENEVGLYIGLGLIALGAGGIKPCVSAHVGDQFTVAQQTPRSPAVFNALLLLHQLGRVLAPTIVDALDTKAHWWGPSVAFGIPGDPHGAGHDRDLLDGAQAVPRMCRPLGERDDTPGRVALVHALMKRMRPRSRGERFGGERRFRRILDAVLRRWRGCFYP